ncbi:MAG: hypothetical protein ABSG36_09010 [Acidimicrobiales bacterium]|jgi:hypothetical protein
MAERLHSAKRLRRSEGTRHWRRIPIVIGAIVALLLGLGAGSAFAYFTTGGSGTGSSSTGNLLSLSLATAGTPTSPLLPGKSGDVVFTATNPNKFSVSIVTVALQAGGSITPDASHLSCTTTDSLPVVTLTVPAGDLPVSIAPKATVTIDLANAAAMDLDATSSCQGASFTIPITITAQSS